MKKTLEKSSGQREVVGNIHPIYCPKLEKDCDSKGIVDCINAIDKNEIEVHPSYLKCPKY